MERTFPTIEAQGNARWRNNAVRTISASSLYVELKADLDDLIEFQSKPIQQALAFLIGSRDRTKQRLTGLEIIRLLEMAGFAAPDDINPDRMCWIPLHRFRTLMAKAEHRRSMWNCRPN